MILRAMRRSKGQLFARWCFRRSVAKLQQSVSISLALQYYFARPSADWAFGASDRELG
jgi:hypothetical protein